MYSDIKIEVAALVVVLITSMGQTLFASILLMTTRHGNRVANRYLAACMLLFSISLGITFVLDFWLIHMPHVILTFQPLAFLLAPLIWLYTQKLTMPEAPLPASTHLIHGLPALIVVLLFAPFYSLSGIEKTEWILSKWGWSQLVIGDVQRWTAAISTPIRFAATAFALPYFYFSYRSIQRHKISIENEFSNTEYISLGWVKYLIISCVIIWLLGLFNTTFGALNIFIPRSTYAIIIIGSGLLTVFGYFGINQSAIYHHMPKAHKTVDTVSISKDLAFDIKVETSVEDQKYKSSNLSKEEADVIHTQLLEYMNKSKPFLNSELTINQLAEQTYISARDLSRVINEITGKNFMEFINAYRIDDAKHRLCSEDNQAVLDIAMDVGFNSKSAFYEAFKRVTNTTPTRYRKEFGKAYREQAANDKVSS